MIVGEGHFLLMQTTFEKYYTSLHTISSKTISKRSLSSMIDGCPWYLGAYSMGKWQATEFLTIRIFKGKHTYNALDNLVVPYSKISKLTSSIMILRYNIDKNANEIRKDMYKDYEVQLNYTRAYRGKERALF